MRLTPAVELEHRCSRLQSYMQAESIDAVIIAQNADLFYFAGTVQSGCLYLPAIGQPLYLVRKDFMRARMESGLKEVIPFSSFREIPSIVSSFGHHEPSRIGFELDVLPVTVHERYRSVFPSASSVDASTLIRKVRMIKSSYEIHLIKDAADQVDRLYRRVREVLRAGMTDLDLSAELEYLARKDGHQGQVRMRGFNSEIFYGHVFSGADGAVPTYSDTPLGGMGLNPSFGQGAGLKVIEKGEPVVVDFAGCVDGYLSDQTRVFSVGQPSDRIIKAYSAMLEIQDRLTESIKEGMSWSGVYDLSLKCAADTGYSDNFMGYKGSQVSFVGHGLGIEIDEYPFFARGFTSMEVEIGMVFALEPKVVFPGEGAVGIENTFYLSSEGLKRVTNSSDELVII